MSGVINGDAVARWWTRNSALVVLLGCAAALFSAGMSGLSLPSLDDAFYARKGVEMARSGASFTVTWAGEPTFQNPPFHFWLLAVSFGLFGEGDLGARAPSLLMGLGTLLLTFQVGRRLTDPATARAGAALLVISPIFVSGARGCMLDLPLAFWSSLALLLFIEGRSRPWVHLAVAAPLAGAILTKSVLGLLPVAVMAAAAAVHPDWRPARARWLCLGVLLGGGLGASWTIQQGLTIGPEAVHAHYVGEIGARAGAGFSPVSVAVDYPLLLLKHYQPIVIPGLLGVAAVLRKRRGWTAGDVLLACWVLLPIVLYSLSAARSARYLYPILPPLALCAALWLQRAFPAVERRLATRIAPAVALTAATLFAVSPATLTRDLNGPFKESGPLIARLVPASEPLPYLGARYQELANPLLYYAERRLAPAAPDADTAVKTALGRPSPLLLCDRDRLGEIVTAAPSVRIVVEGARWALLEIEAAPEEPAAGVPSSAGRHRLQVFAAKGG